MAKLLELSGTYLFLLTCLPCWVGFQVVSFAVFSLKNNTLCLCCNIGGCHETICGYRHNYSQKQTICVATSTLEMRPSVFAAKSNMGVRLSTFVAIFIVFSHWIYVPTWSLWFTSSFFVATYTCPLVSMASRQKTRIIT